MLSPVRAARSPVQSVSLTQCRLASTHHHPPSPRPYPRSGLPKPAFSPKPEPILQPRKGILRHIWPFSKGVKVERSPVVPETPDPARGQEAANRVVQTGRLDERYRNAAKHVTRIIAALPLVLYLGYVLYQRRFLGVEQKKLPKVKRQEELR